MRDLAACRHEGTSRRPKLVAEQSGFGSSSDFARAFRAVDGMTPRAYREHSTQV
jgi:AraC-like DNA-binding protein